MKAVAVFPGKANSIHLAELAKPSISDIPGGRGVLVKVLRVGVDGTDKEINAAEYGQAPEGFDFLVTGHESFGKVVEVGPQVTHVAPGDYVVATVRRLGKRTSVRLMGVRHACKTIRTGVITYCLTNTFMATRVQGLVPVTRLAGQG